MPAVGGDSPAGFYATLLQTRALLRRVVAQDFRTVDGRSGSLPDILGLEGTPEERVERAAAWLRNKRFVVSVDRQTSVVQVRVRTFDPLLSAGLTSALLAAVDEYNVATRRSAGANEREFLAARLNEKNEELRVLDDSLEAFLLQNRRITENAPALLFQEDRLRRRVMLQQQVLASLASALEDARIREIRDTPTTTVIEPATVPSEAESRHLIAKAFIGLALGLIFGITAAAAVELVSRRAEPA